MVKRDGALPLDDVLDMGAVEDKNHSENVTRVLYPEDSTEHGKELRLRQEYFFVSASLQDILRRYMHNNARFHELSQQVAIHLNDTHPAIAVAELMRLLDGSSRAEGVRIYIGGESQVVPFEELSVVSANYEVDGQVVGTLGVIGPTRMAYERVIPIVDITSRLLSNALSHG